MRGASILAAPAIPGDGRAVRTADRLCAAAVAPRSWSTLSRRHRSTGYDAGHRNSGRLRLETPSPGHRRRSLARQHANDPVRRLPRTRHSTSIRRRCEVMPITSKPTTSPTHVLGHDFYGPIIEHAAALRRLRARPAGRSPAHRASAATTSFPTTGARTTSFTRASSTALIERSAATTAIPRSRSTSSRTAWADWSPRYYLRYGTVDVLDGDATQLVTLYGTARVRKLILLGTPNFGSAASLHAFLDGEPIGFRRIPPEVLATMPSRLPALSASDRDVADRHRGPRASTTICSTARRGGATAGRFSIPRSTRASGRRAGARRRRLSDALPSLLRATGSSARGVSCGCCRRPEPATPIRYVLFGGDCELTPARLALEDDEGTPACA